MRGALISGLSCATCSASARRAGCRIARRPSWPRFWRYCAPPDAGWSRFPHGPHPWPLCAAFRHPSPPSAIPQRRPLTPRAAKLWTRLSQHKGQQSSGGGNHRGSIFRLIVGTALIKRHGYDHPTWGIGNSAKPDVRTGETALEIKVSQIRLAKVRAHSQPAHARIPLCKGAQHFGRVVGAAVVDEDDRSEEHTSEL